MTETVEQSMPASGARTDAQVWNDLRGALGRCLQLDATMSAKAGTAEGDKAAEAFDREVDNALMAFADLVCRGVTGLFEDVLLERALAGDAAEAVS